jgi:osmotically-inducible protein OsmY
MQKTDAHIQQDIIAELKWDPSIDATHIQVVVHGGDVTLTGRVSNQAEKLNVERSIKRVSGVNAVTLNLDYAMPESSTKADIEIENRAINLLEWMTYWHEESIEVAVKNGWVTLTGELDWKYQQEAAVDMIRHLIGVAGVIDKLTIIQIASTNDIKTEIEHALRRHIDDGAELILVDVRAGDVTLSGMANNWQDVKLAIKSASSTFGVWNVQNDISVRTE